MSDKTDSEAWFATASELTHALHHFNRHLVLCTVRWGFVSCKVFSWPKVCVLMLLPQAIWNSVARDGTHDDVYTHRPLQGWAVVAPRCFHFTIIALIVDWGRSSRIEISQTDLWRRQLPMTVPGLKSLRFLRTILISKCLTMKVSLTCANSCIPVNNGCGWNTWTH